MRAHGHAFIRLSGYAASPRKQSGSFSGEFPGEFEGAVGGSSDRTRIPLLECPDAELPDYLSDREIQPLTQGVYLWVITKHSSAARHGTMDPKSFTICPICSGPTAGESSLRGRICPRELSSLGCAARGHSRLHRHRRPALSRRPLGPPRASRAHRRRRRGGKHRRGRRASCASSNPTSCSSTPGRGAMPAQPATSSKQRHAPAWWRSLRLSRRKTSSRSQRPAFSATSRETSRWTPS